MAALRPWQQTASQQVFEAQPRDWLTCATPGAGKTTYFLNLAATVFERQLADRLILVVPTDHLRRQWIAAAEQFGFDLRAVPNDERLPDDAHGAVVTYAQVAARPGLHAMRVEAKRTIVGFDEVHHAGDDRSWGSGVLEAFERARMRFSLTGTPFRSDDAQIAHVRYAPDAEGRMTSVPDYTYGYGEALRDGVVRPVVFATYTGTAEWLDAEGARKSAALGSADLSAAAEDKAWRTALDPKGAWLPHVMEAAWSKVLTLRASTVPDAKVLIPAANQETARAYADLWRRVTGDSPAVILSDDPAASDALAEYRDNPQRICAVCVRMVTEGVDVPAASVLLYTTTAATPLFFAQLVGRVVRARSRQEVATVFLPAVRQLVSLAASMEVERRHVLSDEDVQQIETERLPAGEGVGASWQPVSASAQLGEVTLGAEISDLLGIEGLLTPEQERALLERNESERAARAKEIAAQTAVQQAEAAEAAAMDRLRRQAQVRAAEDRKVADGTAGVPLLRKRCASAVSGWAASRGTPHAQAWAILYNAVPGPKNSAADADLLRARLEWIDNH